MFTIKEHQGGFRFMSRDYLNKTVHNKNGETLTVVGFTLGDKVSEDIIQLSNGKSYQIGIGVGNGYLRFDDEEVMNQIHQEKVEEEEEERRVEENRLQKMKVQEEFQRLIEQSIGDPIKEFRGDYRFLSNFFAADVTYNGVTYHNNEAAFQAQKDPRRAEEFMVLTNPVAAKRLGRKVQLRKDWEKVKVGIMEEIVRNKFSQNPELKEKLLNTGDRLLIEGVKDNFWGGTRNELGKILMKVRMELRETK